MSEPLPETILQFGAGRFLRGFADLFVQQANDAGQAVGRIVVVQTTPGSRVEQLNAAKDGYHVAIRGIENGTVVDRTELVRSLSRGLLAAAEWDEVVRVACSPELRCIISNTTEAGYATSHGDKLTDAPPQSFPAKLTQLLWRRFEARMPPPMILPCELVERNASKLRDIVQTQAIAWNLPTAFLDWTNADCLWLDNLVDRMVVSPRPDHPLFDSDPLLVQTEPYALWAIQKPHCPWQPLFTHPAVEIVEELTPYYLRKVRILNGIHSALVAKCLPMGYETVRQSLQDPQVMDWVLGLLYEEIVPTIAYRVEDVARFARQTLDRLANPFMEHRLADIQLNHEAKVALRLRTTCDEYQKLFGRPPRRLAEVIG